MGIFWDSLICLTGLETPQKKEIYFVFFGQIRVWTLRWASFPVSQADFQANPEKWEDYDTRYELKISTVWYDHKSDVRLHMPLWPYTFRFSGAHERDTRVLVFPHAQNVHTQPGVEF